MKDLSTYAAPLEDLTKIDQPFIWTQLHDKCMDMIKHIATSKLVLQLIDAEKNEPIWVVTDTSIVGISAYYGQGEDWISMRPAGFHSRKFTPAQVNYATHEQEILVVLEALMKWEDKLLGREFLVITDHRTLEFFKTQPNLSRRQI